MTERRRSGELFARAQGVMPGGVNSPVRSFRAVGGGPVFFARGAGSRVHDVDGHEYIDCVGSWGPLILGHAHPRVVERVARVARDGLTFGACIAAEVEMAELLTGAVPSLEMVRLVSSGTEAVMSAVRLARAFTNRPDILKFDGCYHGHSDGLLARAGSGVATLGLPDSPGVPADFAAHTLIAPYNDLDAVRAICESRGRDLAAIIVEPVAGNMGVAPPRAGFLEGLREIATTVGALLIFDEVITGFRVAWGGAQARYGVSPDLTTLGKIIGGGLPVGAYGGRREIMAMIAPAGPVYQAGTLSGNPVALAAGLETLRVLSEPAVHAEGIFRDVAQPPSAVTGRDISRPDTATAKSPPPTWPPYDHLELLGAELEAGLLDAAAAAGVPASVNRVGAMLTLFFTPQPPWDCDSARTADTALYGRFFGRMLEAGVYLPPSQFEAIMLSTAHTSDDLRQVAAAAGAALAR